MTETLIKLQTYLLLFHFTSTVRMLEDFGEEKREEERAEKIIERVDCFNYLFLFLLLNKQTKARPLENYSVLVSYHSKLLTIWML